MNNKSAKIYDIEILRAIAVIYTIVLHLKVLMPSVFHTNNWFYSNFELSTGVDLFFVISGFVITKSIANVQKNNNASRNNILFSFWIKRVYRLLPAAWLWLFVSLIFYITTDQLDEHYKQLLAAALNMMNLYSAYCVSNASDICGTIWHLNGHYWSLSLEEQFYLIFPLLFIFLRRHYFVAIVVVLILWQLLLPRPLFSYSWYFRTDGLCWGVLLALISNSPIYKHSGELLQKYRKTTLCGFVSLVIFLPYFAAHSVTEDYAYSVIAIISAILVWIASHNRNLLGTNKYYRQIALHCGKHSYSLYLSHLVIFMAIDYMYRPYLQTVTQTYQNTLVWGVLIGATTLSFVFSWLTYRYVELAMRNKGIAKAQSFTAR